MLLGRVYVNHYFGFVLVLSALLGILSCSAQKSGNNLDVLLLSLQPDADAMLAEKIVKQKPPGFNRSIDIVSLKREAHAKRMMGVMKGEKLPDLVMADASVLFGLIAQGKISKLSDEQPPELQQDFIVTLNQPNEQNKQLVALPVCIKPAGMLAHMPQLKRAAVRIPQSVSDAWDETEFENALSALSAHAKNRGILDMRLKQESIQFAQSFIPFLHANGAALLDNNSTQKSAEGVLNNTNMLQAVQRIKTWYDKGYLAVRVHADVEQTPLVFADDVLLRRYKSRLGKDVEFVPFPDFGHGSKTSQNAYYVIAATNTRQLPAVQHYVSIVTQADFLAKYCDAISAVPARLSALEKSTQFNSKGVLRLAAQLSRYGYSLPLPRTPAYPELANSTQESLIRILNNENPRVALEEAVVSFNKAQQSWRAKRLIQ